MRIMRRYYVYVQFAPTATNQAGQPYSLEPRKWHKLLHEYRIDPHLLNISREVLEFGYSEWPTSFNIQVGLDESDLAGELALLRSQFTGAVASNIFVPIPGTTPPLMIIPRQAEVIPFRVPARIAA